MTGDQAGVDVVVDTELVEAEIADDLHHIVASLQELLDAAAVAASPLAAAADVDEIAHGDNDTAARWRQGAARLRNALTAYDESVAVPDSEAIAARSGITCGAST